MEKKFNLLIDTKRTDFNTVRGLKQGDNNSVLNITLVQNSIPFDLNDLTVRINYKRPDNKLFLQMADVVNATEGKIKVNILTKALETAGEIKSDLSIFDSNNRKITSTIFSMFVDASIYKNDYIEPEDLDLIQQIYTEEEKRIRQEKVREENENIRKENETTRETEENKRIRQEKVRKENENKRVESENERADAESIRKSNETNRNKAEKIRQANEKTRLENEDARVTNETKRIESENKRETQEKARQQGYTNMQNTVDDFSICEEYNPKKEYKKLNRVTYNGSSYECLKDCTGIEPLNAEHWICIARKGKDGDGAGDMLKSIYDKNDNGIVDVAEKANSVEWENINNAPDLDEIGKVKSVNSKTGDVELKAIDIKTTNGHTMEIELKNIKADLKNNMLKEVYDKNQNGKVDVAEIAESVDWENVKNKPDLNRIGKVTSVNGQTGAVTLYSSGIKYRYQSYDSIYDVIEGVKKDIKNIDLNAEKVSLSSTNFRSQNVKAALEELFTFADNGKKNWVDVIGSPLSTGDSFSTLKNKTQTLKNNFASNLNSKKVSASSTESLNSLIDKIKNIDTGLKYATGTCKAPSKNHSERIKGISFTPKFIYACGRCINGPKRYPFLFVFVSKEYLDAVQYNEKWGTSALVSTSEIKVSNNYCTISSVDNGSFSISTSHSDMEDATVSWVAIGK